MEKKRKFSPNIETKLPFFYMVYMENFFFQDFLRYTKKLKEILSSIVFYTVRWTTVFQPILLF